jgi:leucyl-tRNA synthetase
VDRGTPFGSIGADFILLQILDVLVRVMAPIVPHLSEEVHDVRMGGSELSVFTSSWETTVSGNLLMIMAPNDYSVKHGETMKPKMILSNW